jgi:hypothetical protein
MTPHQAEERRREVGPRRDEGGVGGGDCRRLDRRDSARRVVPPGPAGLAEGFDRDAA